MKEYKTWEILKLLEENPSMKVESNFSNDDFDSHEFSRGFINAKFRIVQQSVTFEEVLKSKKRCRVEHELTDTIEKTESGIDIIAGCVEKIKDRRYLLLSDVLLAISWIFTADDVKKIIKDGKWYLEEE